MEICDWLIKSFTADVNKADVACQEELLEIRHDEEGIANFNSGSYKQLWRNQKMENLYQYMSRIILKLLITLPSSYLVEADFRAVNKVLTKKRNA